MNIDAQEQEKDRMPKRARQTDAVKLRQKNGYECEIAGKIKGKKKRLV